MTTPQLEARDARAAAAGAPVKRSYVQRIFSEIAPRYDLLNRLLSGGIDRSWRRAAIDALGADRRPSGTYLDLCAGTLDISAAIAARRGFGGHVVGADFAEPMLRAGRRKAKPGVVAPVVADALALPVAGASCDGAIVAFGIRNVVDMPAAFREILRVLTPGARFVILEFSTPRLAIIRSIYELYSRRVLPLVGALISGHPTAYQYLPDSIAQFPSAEKLKEIMAASGFVNVSIRPLTFGIAALHVGEKR
ncbi:MAG TPA: bifunctional demethylmenaquinone methyltransferase/2-methoxy-6-polyprenyl-1,4-benzoquinol methylase UbiE [Gemmatimonadaceae bacterium]